MSRIRQLWDNYYRKPADRTIRWFGMLLACLPALIIYARLGFTTPIWFAASGIPLVLLVYLPALRVVYATMMLITRPVGWVVSSIVLLVIYAVVLTPFSFLRKRSFPPGWQTSESVTDASRMHE